MRSSILARIAACAGAAFVGSFTVLLTARPCFAHPGHPHFPGVSTHMAFEPGADLGLALILSLLGLCLGASFIELAFVMWRLLSRVRRFAARARTLLSMLLSLFLLSACSGGGGGGDDGGTAKRPGAPGVRILHGSLDIEPVRLNTPLQEAVTVSFADERAPYLAYPKGPQSFVLERKNAPGVVVGSASGQIAEETYYSLLLSGEANDENFRVSLLPELADRADKGKARVQLVHALAGARGIVMNGSGFTAGPIDFAASSGFIEVPAGLQTFTFGTADGRDLGRVTVTLGDRGESTIFITGNLGDGVIVKRVYDDLG